MKNIWRYVLLFLGVFLVAFCAALPLFGFGMMRFGGMGMRRAFGLPGIGGMPMMTGNGGFGILNAGFMLLRMAVPLLLLALLVVGLVLLMRRTTTAPVTAAVPATQAPAVETEPCPNCGRPVQKDWSLCPYCGTRLVEETPPPPPETNP